jgi:protein-disulfide isomerase
MTSMHRSLLYAAALCAVANGCDNAKRSDVEGLQQRLDTIASEQAELRKRVDQSLEGARAQQSSSTELAADVAATKAELETLEARVAVLETAPKPDPLRRPIPPGSPDPAERYVVGIDDAFAEGPSDARVTIVMFSDFQCPFCGRVQATLSLLQTAYKDDVRLVAKHNPLPMHANAMAAARAAEAAGKQGKFWEMHDKLYEQAKALAQADLEGYAKDLGLDVARFRRDMDDAGVQSRIDAHVKQSSELGARGTPAFFINGRYLSGAQPLEAFKVIVDGELAKADVLIAGGVARARVYDELMATAKPGVGKGGGL